MISESDHPVDQAKDPGGKDSIEDDRTCDRKDFRTNTEDLSFFFIFNGRRSDSVCKAGDGTTSAPAPPHLAIEG